MRYNNYHRHSHESNIRTLDCVVKPIDYINRALELGHNTYFTTEHGWSGNFLASYDLCKQNGLKMIYGAEAYIVKDRFEKDSSNAHIIIIAKNKNGFIELNRIMSEANKTGFYYKPRIDLNLIKQLTPGNFIITTACVAGIASYKYAVEDFIEPIYNHFKNNLYFEIQSHNHILQKHHNIDISKIAEMFGCKLIHANDSHYIYPEQEHDRDLFLKGKGLMYEEETGFILDYPDYNTILERYEKQGILKTREVKAAINNTLIFDECEDLNFTKEIKMPKVGTYKDSDIELKKILNEKFKKLNIDKSRFDKYVEAIKFEMNIIEKTNTADYFILNEKIISKAINEYNAVLTRSGRGSGVSYLLNKLLGFTEIDRLKAPVPLYPTRFMSISRILETGSLPDIDFNFADIEPVVKASKDILGDDGVYFMFALTTMQESSAFRNLCRAYNLNVDEYNDVAKSLDDYRDHEVWGKYIKESEKYIGTIESVSPSPCSFILLNKPISEELGLIKVGNEICACIDGITADTWKYLKNDYLTVKVWKIISDTFDLIGIDIPSIDELESLIDEKVWTLYEKGLTATLNQVDTDISTKMVMEYKPKSIAELSAFVAAIRPGFASLVNKFLKREEHSTGVKELDELLSDSFHYLLYQENLMQFFVWCGIPEEGTYDIIKKIAKKRFKESEIKKFKKKLLKGFIDRTGSDDKFNDVWKVVEDAANYAFNASHSLSVAWDSVYGAYLKVNYPIEYYTVVLNEYFGDTDKTAKIKKELSYFNITIKPVKFRYSHNKYMFDKSSNTIYKGLSSIKGFGEKHDLAAQLLELKNLKYSSFIDLLYDIKEKTNLNNSHIEILIKLNFFSEFGELTYLEQCYNIFNQLHSVKQLNKEKLVSLNIDEEIVRQYAAKETEKLYKEIDVKGLIYHLCNSLITCKTSIADILINELIYYGYMQTTFNVDENFVIITDINTKYTPKFKAYVIKIGEEKVFKIYKNNYFTKPSHDNPKIEPMFDLFDVIYIQKEREQNSKSLVDNEWVDNGNTEIIVEKYSRIEHNVDK